jgi:hypothetical protein
MGLSLLKDLPTKTRGSMDKQIGELEALLIRALGLENNYAQMRFPGAKPWEQVKAHELAGFLRKVAR